MGDPEVGRPLTLGVERDRDDAGALLSVVEEFRTLVARGGQRSGAARVLREAVWFLWEQPRLPRPLVGSKYPLSYPWSPPARDRWLAHGRRRPQGGWGLVIEHIYPRECLIADLVDDPLASTPAAVIEVLSTRLIAAVITSSEDRMLPSRSRSPREWTDYEVDPWVRYRMAGLPVSEFRSAESSPPEDSAPKRPGRPVAGDGPRSRHGRHAYARFWAPLVEQLQAEHPEWGPGRANRNDLRLFSPLPRARIKCNFSREGPRVELLLEAEDAAVNARRLTVLDAHLGELQAALGGWPTLRLESLEGKTQARLAAYRSGTQLEASLSALPDQVAWIERVRGRPAHLALVLRQRPNDRH